ncbi:PTS sugar transporter subunit IIB [Thermohalobacter berrensis]|uniref:PTS sugar transporter subunit IIB n=1 Tax=Thermohalobacter berrensis TaxID=99594 RepID=A0A419T4C9_9FIRM|nr:PTS sugar transporter subunit IIB [Thermohalobacter berrensis]RKD32305.1 PTS sugar transporter subunit IIB [Thermohalobacter berrensis]
MKILLCCAAGMSTSLIVEKMKKAAETRNMDVTIEAVSVDEIENVIQDYDVVLLGPQVKYKKNQLQKLGDKHGKKVDVINPVDYGLVKGDKILDFAIKLREDE